MKDADLQLGWILHRLFRAFKNDDPKIEHQKAIPVNVIAELGKRQMTEMERAIAQLAMGAYFFACRSCEYLKVPQDEKRCTDILKMRNVRFFKHGIQLHAPSQLLESADSVSLMFEMQKNKRNTTQSHMVERITNRYVQFANGRKSLTESGGTLGPTKERRCRQYGGTIGSSTSRQK